MKVQELGKMADSIAHQENEQNLHNALDSERCTKLNKEKNNPPVFYCWLFAGYLYA